MFFILIAVILATCRSLFDGNDLKDKKCILWKRRFIKGRPEIYNHYMERENLKYYYAIDW